MFTCPVLPVPKFKNMLNKLLNEWRRSIIFGLLVMMILSLFVSRSLLSVSMIGFVIAAFLHSDIAGHVRHFLTSPLLWGMSVLFLLPLLSGIWSADSNAWVDMVRIKMPLLFLPLAFAGNWQLSKKEWEWLALIFLAAVTTGTIWSLFYYVSDARAVNESYLRAKSIVTPLEDDHVRFSWLVNAAILLAGWMLLEKKLPGKFFTAIIIAIITWLIIFLHILAARTGLLSFYLTALVAITWFIIKHARRLIATALLIVILAMPVAAYFILPTFHNRVRYFLYDINYFRQIDYVPGTTDRIRLISMKAGWELMKTHPVSGVGFGDILSGARQWYDRHYPGMIEKDKIYPSSEWLMYGAGCGWGGFLLFTGVMMIPFLLKQREHLVWWLLNITAAFSFLFDIGLETQFGVFIYSFIVLWLWKWLEPEKM